MLSNNEKIIITACINEALDNAERHWRNGGHTLMKSAVVYDSASEAFESAPSHIPGHTSVQDNETVIDEFIALVADMRDSSKHLNNSISQKTTKVTLLQRVYYETSALLPALAQTINFKSGSVTEYLGDGILALFQVDPTDRSKAIYAAHAAAANCIGDTRLLVNAALEERYSLPPLDLGVGLAMSKAIVTLVGLQGEKHPKAFGQCVFRATKLSNGKNEIFVDAFVRGAWPRSKGGKLKFIEKARGDLTGYLISQ